jgi:hypothetical protein
MAEGNGDQRGNNVLALAILQDALLACALVCSAVTYATDR